jgi:sigma-B regulation protein RsbU (phosphoserine phosphatase)
MTGNGLALGMFEQATYDSATIVIEPGDMLVLFSDGITEAENAAGRPFDDAGLEGVVAAHAGDDPEAAGRAILKAVEAYTADARLTDDLTALVLKRHSHGDAGRP